LGYLVIRLTPLFASFLEWERGSAGKGQSSDPEGERLAWPIGDPIVIRLISTLPLLPHFLVRGKRVESGAKINLITNETKRGKSSLIIK
jgi:hypothetical protein